MKILWIREADRHIQAQACVCRHRPCSRGDHSNGEDSPEGSVGNLFDLV